MVNDNAGLAVAAWQQQLTRVDTGQETFAVLDSGSGDAVLFLHGIPTQSWLWRDVVWPVAMGYRVVVPDLPGFGFSEATDSTDVSPAGLADALERLLARLDISRYTLVGHDYGALVACELLSRNPHCVDRLVLTNTSLNHEDWTSRSPLNPLAVFRVPVAGEAALKAARPFMLKQAFARFVDNPERLTDEAMELYWAPFRLRFDRTLLKLSRENRLD